MINLIPPKAKRIVVKEYWIRVLSVWGILIAIVGGIAALFLLPTYVLIHSQLSALEQEVLQQSDAEAEFKSAEELVKEANTAALQLSKPTAHTLSFEVVAEIHAAANGIQPDAFRISRTGEGTIGEVHVQGTARSREVLAGFKNALERSSLFGTAAIPISDLARETELPFSITITMAETENE